jgi:hypothetical protein
MVESLNSFCGVQNFCLQTTQFIMVYGWLVFAPPALFGVFKFGPRSWRTMKRAFETLAFRAFIVFSSLRSEYRWRLRMNTPKLLRPVGDWVFNLRPHYASVDCPRNVAESILILNARLTIEGETIEVAGKIQKKFREDTSGYGHGSTKVALYVTDLLDDVRNLSDLGTWSLEIIYVGHADPRRLIPAAEFGVKYVASISSAILFPPYEATEKIRKGLGSTRIIHARTFHEWNLTSLATKYAGLRVNFYEDVQDSQVQKFYIDHQETHVLLSKKGAEPTTIIVSKKKSKNF